jgi:hypothetical protein
MSTERVPNLCLRSGSLCSVWQAPEVLVGRIRRRVPSSGVAGAAAGRRTAVAALDRAFWGLVAMRGGPAGSRCDREARHAVSQAAFAPAPASPSRNQHGVPSDKIADHVARDR